MLVDSESIATITNTKLVKQIITSLLTQGKRDVERSTQSNQTRKVKCKILKRQFLTDYWPVKQSTLDGCKPDA